jgi:Flp pilus assembly secretin CpaC/tetratricopeptide (TPR) repeat protein
VFIGVSKMRWTLGVLTAVIILCTATSVVLAADSNAKQQAMQMQGKQFLDIAAEQYNRGLNEDAKATVRKAEPYKSYLSASDQSRLEQLVKSLGLNTAAPVTQPVAENIPAELMTQARTLAAQGNIAGAKEKYLQAKQTGKLTAEEAAAVDAELAALDQAAQNPQAPVQQPGVNNQYIQYVPVDTNATQKPVAPTTPAQPAPEANTPGVVMQPIEPITSVPAEANAQQPAAISPVEPQQTTPPTEDQVKENYIETVQQKQRIQQSYTKAVVNEAVAKAKDYSAKEEFPAAKEEISRAKSVVEKNKMLLGDEDYKQYTATLEQLTTDIDNRQAEIEKQNAEKSRAEAQASQEKLRAQQAADKQKRINDLLDRANEYQEQQRYEEALAQVDTLLAIDPTNREGAIRKQMLHDIINLRTQLEIKKEIGQQEEVVLTDVQRSMIPHAELMTYPRNWQDISAKRKSTLITGISQADQDVYNQLQVQADLSALTPETPFNEAIEIIKNSVTPPLKIVVLWKDLADNAYIEQDTPIGMHGFAGMPIGEALRTLLTAISGGVANIDYTVKEGIITIATKESLPASKLVTQVYTVNEIIGAGADFEPIEMQSGGGGGEGEIQVQSSSSGTQDSESLREENSDEIVTIIQETIAPESWLINGGEGTVTRTANDYRLIISQTPQIHLQIQKLLDDLRASKGEQVSIEARFLFVTENFLEDIGVDTDFLIKTGNSFTDDIAILQDSAAFTQAVATGVPGSIGGAATGANIGAPVSGGVGRIGLSLFNDDLQLSFLIRATQAHRDAKVLTAPRLTVISGERANINLQKSAAYISDYEFEDITAAGEGQATRVIANPTSEYAVGGVTLNITPIISDDKKYVNLLIITQYQQFNLDTLFPVFADTTGEKFFETLPTYETSLVQTHVNVPDGGTLLIGGQKLGAEINREAGVPGASKVPVIGRLFSNRSKVKDQEVLLILVKPSIIIKAEAEEEFFAPLKER